MPTDILNKKDMYNRLIRGEFGNTIPQFLSIEEWRASGLDKKYNYWGVRSLTPGGPCKLNCPTTDVDETVRSFYPHKCNISIMVDRVTPIYLWAEILYSPEGLVVYGIEYPKINEGWDWRNSMPIRGRHWKRSEAVLLLRRHLNANSREDLELLLSDYPDHVVELSALGGCFGTVEHRNAVIWEVRKY